jgi:hypothetical protein
MAHGTALKYELLNLGGGVVDGIPPEHIEDIEAASLVNWIPFGSKLRRREGTARITGRPYFERITSLFPYKLQVGTWLLLAGTQTGVAKLDGDTLVRLPISDGSTYPSSLDPWHFRQYRNEVLAARRGTGTLKRVTADLIQDAGIAAPTTAPTLADGGAGAIEGGTYYGVVTFYNPTTGVESNPSPVSNALVLAPGRKRAWSGIPVSTNGQVGARRLYVTLADQTGEYYFAATVPDNTSTTFTENTDQAGLGRQVSFDNDLPPDNIELVETWRERSWISDGRDVFFSNIIAGEANVQGFGAFNIIPVQPDDGHKIRVLHAHGSQLIVGKTNAIYFITAVGGGFGLDTLSDKHGCVAPFSMLSAERQIFWYSGENVYRSDGVNVVSISTVKIRRLLDNIPLAMKEKVVGAIVPRLSLYILTVSQGTVRNELMLVYNYKTDVWTTAKLSELTNTSLGDPSEDHNPCIPNSEDPPCPPIVTDPIPTSFTFLGDFYDANFEQVLYAALFDGHVYQFLTGDQDFGTNIEASYRGKALGLDQGGLLKGVRRASVLCTTAAENMTLQIFNDGAAAATTSRVVSLDRTRGWKRYSLSTMGKLGAVFQLGLLYTGRTAVELDGVILEAMGFKRSGGVL